MVTAINAAIFLGEPPIAQGSSEYERLVDLVCARNGAAIGIEKALAYLRLEVGRLPFSLKNIRKLLNEGYPVGITVQSQKYGYHSCLIVDIRGSSHRIEMRILNLRHHTKRQWILWKDLKTLIRPCSGFGEVASDTRDFWAYFFCRNALFETWVKLNPNLLKDIPKLKYGKPKKKKVRPKRMSSS